MSDFSQSVYLAIAVSVTASVCKMLTGNGKLSRSVQYALSLAVISSLLIPVGIGLGRVTAQAFSLPKEEWAGTSAAEKQAQTVLIERARESIEQGISALLEQRFGISPETVEITLTVDAAHADAVKITGVAVHLRLARDAYLVPDVVRYLEDQMSAPVTVTAEEDRLWGN